MHSLKSLYYNKRLPIAICGTTGVSSIPSIVIENTAANPLYVESPKPTKVQGKELCGTQDNAVAGIVSIPAGALFVEIKNTSTIGVNPTICVAGQTKELPVCFGSPEIYEPVFNPATCEFVCWPALEIKALGGAEFSYRALYPA